MSNELTEIDILLSTKYKEMAGYFNIINNNNDTILSGNVTIQGNLNISKESLLHNNVYVDDLTNINNNVYTNNIVGNNIYTNNFNVTNITTKNDIFINGNINISGNLETNNIQMVSATFQENLYISSYITVNNNILLENIKSNTEIINIDSEKINIGKENSIININGTTITLIQANKISKDKNIILNNNNDTNGGDSGIEIYSGDNVGYIKILPDASRFIIKTPLEEYPKYLITFDKNENLIISGYSIFNKNVTINSSLNVQGNILFNDDININSNLTVSNLTTIYGNSTIYGNLYIDNNYINENNITSNGNLYVNDKSILKNVLINSNLNIFGNTYFKDSIDINSNFIVSGNSIFNNITCNSHLIMSNDTLIKNNINCNNDIKLLNDINVNSDVIVKNNIMVVGNSIHTNNVTVLSHIEIGGSAYLKKNSIIGSEYKLNTERSIFNIKGDVICPLKDFQTNSIAAFNNIPVWGFYRTGGIVKVRLDVVPPTMQLNGNTSYTILVGDSFNDPGVEAFDDEDGFLISYLTSITSLTNDNNLLSSSIKVEIPMTISMVSTLQSDAYKLIYYSSDTIGNISSIERLLNISTV